VHKHITLEAFSIKLLSGLYKTKTSALRAIGKSKLKENEKARCTSLARKYFEEMHAPPAAPTTPAIPTPSAELLSALVGRQRRPVYALTMVEVIEELQYTEARLRKVQELVAKFLAELAGLVTSMAPMSVAKVLAGSDKTIASAAPLGRDLAIQKFLKTLDQKKVMGIMQLREPTQQMSLMEIYKSYAEDDAKEQANRPEVLRDGIQEEKEVH